MTTKKEEEIVEGEILGEASTTPTYRRGRGGLFLGTILLVWGGVILLDTYLGTDLGQNIWPLIAVIFGIYLVASSFKR